MFDQKKLVLSLCVATCAVSLAACGGDDNDSSVTGKECTSVVNCGDTTKYRCADAFSNGKKVCVPKDICSNNLLDKDFETDTDCGGYCTNINYDNANTCANNQKCKVGTDCTSGVCEEGKCTVKSCNNNDECGLGLALCQDHSCITCTDGIKNNDESDVDCGGWCGATCKNGQKCSSGADCLTNKCEEGKCAGEIPECDPTKFVVNEILHATGSSPVFLLNNNAVSCDFIEVASVATEAMSLEKCSLTWLRTDDGKGTNEVVQLSGIIQPKHTLVINNCDTLPLPSDATSVKAKLGLSGKNYDITISDGETDNSVSIEAINNNKTSFNRATDYDSAASFSKTTDIAGALAFATPGYCFNGGTFSTGCQPACNNKVKDSFETDKDCGGACGATCSVGAVCTVPGDCSTNNCDDGHCAVQGCSTNDDCGTGLVQCQFSGGSPSEGVCITCSDGVANYNESDIDCGGWCGATCGIGDHCNSNADCITEECGADEKCTGEPPKAATLNDLVINEVLVTADTNKEFGYLNGDKQCEFIEIVNINEKTISLNGVSVSAILIKDDGSETASINKLQLSGNLPSKRALVLHNIEQCPLPNMTKSGAVSQNITKNVLTNSKNYKVFLTIDNNNGTEFTVASTIPSSHSATLTTDMDPSSAIVDHTIIADGVLASPGMCSNGYYFINDCASTCSNGVIDNGEMGADCGGICEAKCANGTKCENASDCESNFCNISTHQCSDSTCSNGQPDAGEMGTDCGGICDAKCANGTDCAEASDCLSGYCNPTTNKCDVAPCSIDSDCSDGGKCNTSTGICETCDDGIPNGYETGTDCGGRCANKCGGGEGCDSGEDCDSGVCDEGTHTCTVSDCETAVAGEIVINEVLNKAASKPMSLTSSNQVEFIELYNNTTKKLSLNNMFVNIKHYKTNGTDYETSSDKAFSIPLNGCLEANKYLLIYSNANTVEGLPATAVSFPTSSLAAANALVNTRKIDMTLTKGTTTLHQVAVDVPTEGVSAALTTAPEKNANNYDILVNHDTINTTYKHTPGASNYYTAE